MAQGQGSGTRRKTCRARGARGATLPEYALFLALVVVVAIAGIQALTDSTDAEVTDQALCIEERPPDPACQIPALDTSTTVSVPTTPTTLPPPPSVAVAPVASGSDDVPGGWQAWATVTVEDSLMVAVPNATVTAIVTIPSGPSYTVSCITAISTGECELRQPINFTDVTTVTFEIIEITVPPPTGPVAVLPDPFDVVKT